MSVFDPDGQLVHRFGGRGEGPGEVAGIWDLYGCADDTVIVRIRPPYDPPAPETWTVLNSAGAWLGPVHLPSGFAAHEVANDRVYGANVLRQIAEPELAETFRAWIRLVILRRFGSKGSELTRKLEKEEKGQMTTLLERARKWGEERDQLWLEKGIAKGRIEGRIEGERELVHRMVSRRFGRATAKRVLALLNNLSDPDDIAALADAVIECQTAAEFLERVREA